MLHYGKMAQARASGFWRCFRVWSLGISVHQGTKGGTLKGTLGVI